MLPASLSISGSTVEWRVGATISGGVDNIRGLKQDVQMLVSVMAVCLDMISFPTSPAFCGL